MPEIIRTRDCVVHSKGDAYAVAVSDAMITGGWPGGQGVAWADSTADEFMVTYSDGLYGGFLLWGSDEDSDQLTAMTGNQLTYRFSVLCAGGWLLSTTTYERYTYASRMAPPLVPIVYVPGNRLRFSLRGYWTTEDEWTASGDPRAPNPYLIGCIVEAPSANNDWYLVIQTSI